MNGPLIWVGVTLTIGLGLQTGCAPYRRPSPPPSPPVVQSPAELMRSRLIGVWERTSRESKGGLVEFAENGGVKFSGALEACNPGRWELNVNSRELYLTLPNAPDETIVIFNMYLKDGVKAVDRPNHRITYHFDPDTPHLNMAGWIYNKVDQPIIRREETRTPIE